LQQHPYAYFSLPKKPVRAPRDLIGRKVGIQATAKVLLNALMKKHDIAEKDVEIVIIGSEMTPILTGQTDVVSGWITNTTNLKRDDELEGSKVLLTFAFNANTQANGWGAFDPAVWQDQIKLYDELKQFSAGAPKLEDVITTKILDATKGARAKVG